MQSTTFKLITQNILLAVIALVPILFLPSGTLTVEPLKTFIIMITGVLFILGIIIYKIKQDSFFVTKNLFALSLGGVIVAGLVSALFSNNVAISLFGRQISYVSFFGLLSLFALMYAVYSSFTDIQEKTRLFLTLYVSGVVIVVIHLLSILLPFFPTLGFFYSNTINTIGQWYDLDSTACLWPFLLCSFFNSSNTLSFMSSSDGLAL
jgi:hypothetical protein